MYYFTCHVPVLHINMVLTHPMLTVYCYQYWIFLVWGLSTNFFSLCLLPYIVLISFHFVFKFFKKIFTAHLGRGFYTWFVQYYSVICRPSNPGRESNPGRAIYRGNDSNHYRPPHFLRLFPSTVSIIYIQYTVRTVLVCAYFITAWAISFPCRYFIPIVAYILQ